MVSHLGRKSVSGGSPSRRVRLVLRLYLVWGFFVHEVIIIDSFRTFVVLRVRNIVAVIRKYK